MIKDLLPPSIVGDANIKALAEANEGIWQRLFQETVKTIILPRIDEIEDESLLDLLAWQFHIEGYELANSIEDKRALIKSAIELHKYKGTPYAIRKALELLKMEGRIKEWYEYEGEPYHFKIEIGSTTRQITPKLREKLITLVNHYKNVRSWLDEIILHYFVKTSLYISHGSMAEAESYAEMIEGYKWNALGNAYIYNGSMAEAEAWAM